jgi:RecA-family ATPase
MTASAIGERWLGMETSRVRSLAVFCEDDEGELHRRQERINRYYDCCMDDLDAMRIESRAGRESVLMRFKQWGDHGTLTPMFERLWFAAVAHRAQIVILDTLADIFSGNEVDRNQPRTFIRQLRRLAIAIQGVVILTQHPSVTGMANGSGTSGSTGWHNSVRSRLYLTAPKKRDEDEDDRPNNERVLKTMKNNAAGAGGKIKLKWSNGVFVREDAPLAWYNQPED